MSASLVGSEMCIRDRGRPPASEGPCTGSPASLERSSSWHCWLGGGSSQAPAPTGCLAGGGGAR
eukprot:7863416-Alexandrium_andersonii.AAC.1